MLIHFSQQQTLNVVLDSEFLSLCLFVQPLVLSIIVASRYILTFPLSLTPNNAANYNSPLSIPEVFSTFTAIFSITRLSSFIQLGMTDRHLDSVYVDNKRVMLLYDSAKVRTDQVLKIPSAFEYWFVLYLRSKVTEEGSSSHKSKCSSRCH